MVKHKKLLIAFGVALLAVSVLVAGTALADTPPKTNTGTPYQSFLDKLAANLGIGVADLTKGITATNNQMLDEAVKNGKLTQAQADKIKERSKGGQPKLGFMGRPFAHNGKVPGAAAKGMVVLKNLAIDALVKVTGKTADQLKGEIKSAGSLQKFLDNNKITKDQLRDAEVQVAQQQLDQAVKDGKITAEQEQRLLDRIKQGPLNGIGPQGQGPKGIAPKGRFHGPKPSGPKPTGPTT